MTTNLNALAAAEHAADLRRAAGRPSVPRRAFRRAISESSVSISLRAAEAGDEQTLRVLAELDEEPELRGDTMLALLDGEAVAAISLDDGRVVANPFVATRDAVALLRLRARDVRSLAAKRPHRRWRPRFA